MISSLVFVLDYIASRAWLILVRSSDIINEVTVRSLVRAV
jgi:hypothetical protein